MAADKNRFPSDENGHMQLKNGRGLEDDIGTRFEPAGPDFRIASFVPSITELLIDIGLIDQIVARTHYCIHPIGTVDRIPAIGGTKKININKLKALAPTHVILNIDENTKEMADAIGKFVPHIVVTHPLAPEDNLKLYSLMGRLFGREEMAAAISAQFCAAYSAVKPAAAQSLDVLYLIWKDPWMTVSRNTYISTMLQTVGWHTMHHDPNQRYPIIEMTTDVIASTDLFLFSSEPYDFGQDDLDSFVTTYECPPEKALLINGEYCSWYGSRAIAGLRYLHRLAREIMPQVRS